MIPAIDVEEQGNDFTDALAIPRLIELIGLFEKEFGCKPIIYVGSLSCVKFIPEFWDCPLWLRAVKSTNIIPNTAIKQAAIINNIDMNYSPNVRKLMLDK
jgi:GH25 family lysozyme M1 (1,4-beta-N-acetylmuramidase)